MRGRATIESERPNQWAFNLLMTVGCAAAFMAALVFVTNSGVSGLGYLWVVAIAWLALAAVVSLGGLTLLLGAIVMELLLLPVSNDAIRDRSYKIARATLLAVALGAVLWTGGRGVVEGLRDNRLVPQQTLYERCMEPRTRTVRHEYKTCRDGWSSNSIGRRGACSHHGGVVRRWVERIETYREHEPAYCWADAASRSWLD